MAVIGQKSCSICGVSSSRHQIVPFMKSHTWTMRNPNSPNSRPQRSHTVHNGQVSCQLCLCFRFVLFSWWAVEGLYKVLNYWDRSKMVSNPSLPPPNRITPPELLEKQGYLDLTGKINRTEVKFPAHTGGCSDVYTGHLMADPSFKVAIKVFRTTEKPDDIERIRRWLNREAIVWHKLKHENVLSFLGLAPDLGRLEACPALISPYCTNGTVGDYIRISNPPVEIRVSLILSVARGLAYLHEQDVIHGDLKPTNVLMSDENVPLVCDFGRSLVLTASNKPGSSTQTSGPTNALLGLGINLGLTNDRSVEDEDANELGHTEGLINFAQLDLSSARDERREVDQFVRNGIPLCFRLKAWMECNGALELKEPGLFKDLLEAKAEEGPGSVVSEIEKDVGRTMPLNIFFGGDGAGVDKLRRALVACSRRNP
ncbi:hypothetical protein D9756_002943 [Leucocoprinus leucothites]|uniref:Protein kinase domain-containing protein n=1 Tax=Leucocoprinus leucothites TaxID=201217 RepID=A0A8H5G7P0_9AGAR|nr:hypothetical protein D9756_002943 [Leucoagaricus leucothites]